MVRAASVATTGVAWLVTPGTEQLVPLVRPYHVPKDLVAKAPSLALRAATHPSSSGYGRHGTLAASDSASGEWNDNADGGG